MTIALPQAAGRSIVPTVMLRAHSLLWHYLWVAPNILLLVLGFLIWKKKLIREIPAFFAFAVLSAVAELTEYATDVTPSVSALTYWRADWMRLLIQGILKFVLIGEIFAHVFGSYESIARLGRLLIRALGVVLVFAAAIAAAYTPQNGHFGIISGARLLEQTIYLIESGLLAFIFVFSFYFHLTWDRRLFGITLGLSISSCVHLASWAVLDTLGLPDSKRIIFVFLDMITYHAVVLMWFYYLLVPQKVITKPAVPLPDHNLEVWNRELERLLQ
jgi:hypothetical protein